MDEESWRKRPAVRSTEALVTVFTLVATLKMLSVLTPREWSSDTLITQSWAPESVVALRPLA